MKKTLIFGSDGYDLSLFSSGTLVLRFALASLNSVTGRVLDLGSGAGGLSRTIKKFYPELEITGVDPNKKAILEANKKAEKIKGLKYLVGRAEKLPFEDDYFDAVLASSVLEHVDDYKKTLQEISRVIKPGGVFHSATPLEADPWVLHRWVKGWIWPKVRYYMSHKHHFSRKELLKEIEKVGFKIEKKWSSQFFFFQLSELVYYKLLEILKVPFGFSIRRSIREKKGGVLSVFLSLIFKIHVFLINSEWFFLRFLPGHILHIKAVKR